MANFRFFKMEFYIFEILAVERVKRVKMRHRAKFHWIGQTVADQWRFFVRRRLEFLKFGNVNSRKGQKGQLASSCQISWLSVKSLLRYGNFSIFQDGGRHVRFSNFRIFNVERSRKPNCNTMPNFMTIGVPCHTLSCICMTALLLKIGFLRITPANLKGSG